MQWIQDYLPYEFLSNLLNITMEFLVFFRHKADSGYLFCLQPVKRRLKRHIFWQYPPKVSFFLTT